MQALLVLARALHFASLVSLAGVLSFLLFVGEPAFAAAGSARELPIPLRRRVAWLLWASLAIAVLSGILWLVLEARSMSGRSLPDVLAQGVVGIVLTRTRFGHDWVLRGGLAVLLAALLLARGRLPRRRRDWLGWTALALAGALLAALAWAGHAGATGGGEGDLHVLCDAAHLLAAAAWLGGLAPLVLLFAWTIGNSSGLDAARRATRRFSVLGVISVGTLLVTGIVNSWFLVGSIPGLIGTAYGRMLLIKLTLFVAMVAVAAVNRQRLTPRLLAAAAPMAALRALRRNALLETALGLAILGVVGALGTTPPALHTQPVWPLPFRLDLDAVPPEPSLRGTAMLHGAMVVLGLAAVAAALLQRRWRLPLALVGIGLVIGFGRLPLSWMLEPAYPTSFEHSPIAYGASSIERGAAVYARHCVLCHGAEGRGDGPAARDLPVKPADLTAAHLLAHSEGDLFWWISEGRAGGAMPGFADALSAPERWDVINFIRARAAGLQHGTLAPAVTSGPAPAAPDFAFEQAGNQETLRQASARQPILLVFYRLPDTEPQLAALAAAEARLGAAGLRLLALPMDTPAPHGAAVALPDFAATSGPETVAAYRLFAGAGDGPCEFLVDRAGFLRARWNAGRGKGLAPPEALLAQLDRLARLPLASQATHVHAH
jgi:putative copper export protein/mono/diheme cytochrome c family protein